MLHLPPFEEDDARDLTRLVWPELLERDAYLRALKVSRGHPYSVMRLAKVGARYFHLSEESLYEVLLEELWENVITRFMLKGLSDTLQDLLFEISIVRFFDMSGFKFFSRRTNLLPETPPSKMLALMDTMNYDVSAVQFDKVKKGYQLQPPIAARFVGTPQAFGRAPDAEPGRAGVLPDLPGTPSARLRRMAPVRDRNDLPSGSNRKQP